MERTAATRSRAPRIGRRRPARLGRTRARGRERPCFSHRGLTFTAMALTCALEGRGCGDCGRYGGRIETAARRDARSSANGPAVDGDERAGRGWLLGAQGFDREGVA